MSRKPILYKVNASPPARAVLMVIDILGLDVETRELNPILREQDTADLIKKNPMKTIPLLEDGEFAIADSHAIIIYLFERYGKPEHSQLYPSDIMKKAIVNQRLFFDCGILFQRLRAVMAPAYSGRLAEMSRSMIRGIEDAYGMLEVYLSQSQYLAADAMTLADISVFSTLSSLHGLWAVDEKRYPKLSQWLTKMEAKDVCIRINKPGADEHVAGLKVFMAATKEKHKSKL